MKSLLIENALIVNEGKSALGYIGIRGEMIDAVAAGTPDEDRRAGYDEVLNIAGRIAMPGVIDTHVHFREPGMTQKGDFRSESRAAVAGGITSVIDMPNTKPATVSLEAWMLKMASASRNMLTNYAFYLGATESNIALLREIDRSQIPGIKLFMGSSTGNMLVADPEKLEEIFAIPGEIVSIHSEDENIIRSNLEKAKTSFGPGYVPMQMHSRIRSREACVESTHKAIALAEKYGTNLHILHVSTADEIEMIREAKLRGKARITAEVCVNYLLFSDLSMKRLGSRVKCNPALKREADRKALLAAVNDGIVDVISTDHAPHLPADKHGDLLKAASGIPMIQHSLAAMLELARLGKLPVELVVKLMCHNPSELFGIEKRGYLREGYYADITLIDQFAPFEVGAQNILYKCGWSPLEGVRLGQSVMATYVNGREIYRQGTFLSDHPGMPLRFRR